MWASMRGRVFPDFVIDMQAVKTMARVEQAMIGAQVGLALQVGDVCGENRLGE